jgi:hypothetical protein
VPRCRRCEHHTVSPGGKPCSGKVVEQKGHKTDSSKLNGPAKVARCAGAGRKGAIMDRGVGVCKRRRARCGAGPTGLRDEAVSRPRLLAAGGGIGAVDRGLDECTATVISVLICRLAVSRRRTPTSPTAPRAGVCLGAGMLGIASLSANLHDYPDLRGLGREFLERHIVN